MTKPRPADLPVYDPRVRTEWWYPEYIYEYYHLLFNFDKIRAINAAWVESRFK
jgi:hypothetical protein